MQIGYRFLLVGEAPAATGKKNLDIQLACRAVKRHPGVGTLAWLHDNHPKLFEFAMKTLHVNVLGAYPGRAGKGAAFPLELARPATDRFEEFLKHRDHIELMLLAGGRVAKAFDIKDVEYFKGTNWRGFATVVVPHPSGVSTWWNGAGNRTRAKKFMEGLL